MRRGFTLVELAIVLVVIGLVMGMAIKGRQLIHVAKVQADLGKLRKQEVALNIYYGKYDSMPTATNRSGSARLDTQVLSDLGLLRPGDLIPSYLAPSQKWVFVRMTPVSKGAVQVYQHNVDGLAVGAQPVIAQSEQGNVVPLKLICYIELMVDDQRLNSGLGMHIQGWQSSSSIPTDTVSAYYDDCDKVPANATYNSHTMRIF